MIGQTAEIAPADKKLYALRDVTATVPSIPLIVSSIMSKKLAEGIDALVLDVKCGSGAFMKNLKQARQLAQGLVDTGSAMGKKMTALITDMNQPLGRTVGNALEIREALDILNGTGPADAQGLVITLAKHMLSVAGMPVAGGGDPGQHLQDGTALLTFQRMVACQGGDLEAALPTADKQIPLPAPKSGYVSKADAEAIGRASLLLGAGRATITDTIDHAVGLSDLKKIGEPIEKGEPLCIVHSNGREDQTQLFQLLENSFEISDKPIEPKELIYETITS